MKTQEMRDGIAEMETTIDHLRKETQQLKEERDALERGNLEFYQKLTAPEF